MKKITFLILAAIMLGAGLAQADMAQRKAYIATFPDATPKCIDCHADKMPKKDDGAHDPNAYGKAVIDAARAAKLDVPTADTYKAVGKIEDFKK